MEQPSSRDTYFHISFVGRSAPTNWVFTQPPPDDPVGTIFGPTNPLWRTFLGQDISEFCDVSSAQL